MKFQRFLRDMAAGRRIIKHVLKISKVCRTQGIYTLHSLLTKRIVTEICHYLLDLLIQAAANPSATASPSTPSSPSPYAYSPRAPPAPGTHPLHAIQNQHVNINAVQPPPMPFKHDMLMRLKIHLRENEHPARPRESDGIVSGDDAREVLEKSGDTSGLGKNEGTVRFIFGPERLVGTV